MRRGEEVRDHMKENYENLRRKQVENRERREKGGDSDEKELFKMKQFMNVESKLAQNNSFSHTPQQPNQDLNPSMVVEGGGFLTRGEGGRRRAKKRSEMTDKRRRNEREEEEEEEEKKPSKPRVPLRGERGRLAERSRKNFLDENRRDADAMAPPTVGGEEEEIHEDFGKVPSYLQKRMDNERRRVELEREEEERRRECPPGMVLMSEEERLATLRRLEEGEREARVQLSKIPFTSDSLKVVRWREELEGRLSEIEAAREIFSKKKVYIRDE